MHPHQSRHKSFHSRNIHFFPSRRVCCRRVRKRRAHTARKCRVWLEGRGRSIQCSDRVFSSRHACLENARHVPPARCGSRRGPVSQVEFVDFFGDRPPVDDLRQPRHLRSCHHILQSTTRPRPKNGLESTMCCTLLRTSSNHHEYEHRLTTNVSSCQLHRNHLFQNFAQAHRLLPRGLMG
jgi:hypothetical protein